MIHVFRGTYYEHFQSKFSQIKDSKSLIQQVLSIKMTEKRFKLIYFVFNFQNKCLSSLQRFLAYILDFKHK